MKNIPHARKGMNPMLKKMSAEQIAGDKMHQIRNVVFNAATFNCSFVWMYMLELYKDKLQDGSRTYADIQKYINNIEPKFPDCKSIQQTYLLLIKEDGNTIRGRLSVDEIKTKLPMYASYFEDFDENDVEGEAKDD